VLSDVRTIFICTTAAHTASRRCNARWSKHSSAYDRGGWYVPADSPLVCACPPPGCESAPNATQDTSPHSKKGVNFESVYRRALPFGRGFSSPAAGWRPSVCVAANTSSDRNYRYICGSTRNDYKIQLIPAADVPHQTTFTTQKYTAHTQCTPHTLNHTPHQL
jgi:hypothetical protein